MSNTSMVRLFIAIDFNETVKDAVYKVLERLKASAVRGTFTLRENLHLTLVFIGEVPASRIEEIKAAMDQVKSGSFELVMRGIGHFRRDGGDIYWIGVEKNPSLVSIYKQLSSELTRFGFAIEKREYKPHLTLGRRVIVKDDFDEAQFSDSISPIKVIVDNIVLMKSERLDGKLVYTPIYQKNLTI